MSNYFFELLKNSINLNIYDLNHLYSNEKLRLFDINIEGRKKPQLKKGMLVGILRFFRDFFKSIIEFIFSSPQKLPKSNILLFSCSKNIQDALIPLKKKMPDSVLLGLGEYGEKKIPRVFAYLISISFFPLIFIKYLKSRDYKRLSFKYIFHLYWLSYGYYILFRIYLRKAQPKLLINSMDHNLFSRAIILAAKHEKIKTAYIQHASVTSFFPPLKFDYAFLDGFDALNKYDNIGASPVKVFLTGFPKSDALFKNINMNNFVTRVGICSADLTDDELIISNICYKLCNQFPHIEFTLRPHPNRISKELFDIANRLSMKFSNPNIESSFDFLKRVDAIIASYSNIHLEAATMNVFPVFYNFSSIKMRDGYGFMDNNLIKYLDEPEELVKILNELCVYKPNIRFSAKYYYETIDTDYDGKSTELVVNLINEILDSKVDMSKWQKIENLKNLEAYNLFKH